MDTEIGSSLFQGASVDNAGQFLQEEEEDIEDQKRRQKEIQSMLTTAMDDFNYDDQSMNSSTNISTDFDKRYKESNLENQMQILYQARVKEVERLTQQLEMMREQMTHMKSDKIRDHMLAEADVEKLKISLQNAQQSYAEKCSQLQATELEKANILADNEKLIANIKNLELEKQTIEFNNCNLAEQVAILEKGKVNQLQDGLIQERHHQEVTNLQHNLETAIHTIERLENDNVELSDKLRKAIAEKDDIAANKSEVINKLVMSFEEAQAYSHELLCSVNALKTENEGLKCHMKELENNLKILGGFSEKTEIIKALQREMDKLKKENVALHEDVNNLNKEHASVRADLNDKLAQITQLQESLAQKSPGADISLQTSQILPNVSMNEGLKNEIQVYQKQAAEDVAQINVLIERIKQLEQDITNLNTQLDLSKKRDGLIIELQEKASKLEEIIVDNQNNVAQTNDVGTSTDNYHSKFGIPPELTDLYNAQLASELIEKEIQIRKELQQVFDKNYATMRDQLQRAKCAPCDCASSKSNELKECEKCLELNEKLKNSEEELNVQHNTLKQYQANQEKDRVVIVRVLDEWSARFKQLEDENEELKQHLFDSRQIAQQEHLKAKSVFDAWSQSTLRKFSDYNKKMLGFKERIDMISIRTDSNVNEIEKRFTKAKTQLQQSHSRKNAIPRT